MNAYYLKANTALELTDALDSAGLNTGDDNKPYYGQCGLFAVDFIGEIFEPTGNTLDEGTDDERPEMASVGGFHCNVYSTESLPAPLAAYELSAPTTPARIIAA
ncbi:MAG: hypothetical protein CMN85_10690 [Spongiibacteraceae bacterium]|nr:hypothetical protein [Spongiibacteraceae bacterium]|tara:strand:+ start:32137 stop:32448 length:312 start_codon:yes stop_codon:yes gene_type:complete